MVESCEVKALRRCAVARVRLSDVARWRLGGSATLRGGECEMLSCRNIDVAMPPW